MLWWEPLATRQGQLTELAPATCPPEAPGPPIASRSLPHAFRQPATLPERARLQAAPYQCRPLEPLKCPAGRTGSLHRPRLHCKRKPDTSHIATGVISSVNRVRFDPKDVLVSKIGSAKGEASAVARSVGQPLISPIAREPR